MRCSKDAHYFAYGPFGPCQCTKYLRSPDTRPEPIQVPEPAHRDQDRPRNTGLLTARILAACDAPKSSATIAKDLDYSLDHIRLMLCHLRRSGRVQLVKKVGRVAFYSRVTTPGESAQTVN